MGLNQIVLADDTALNQSLPQFMTSNPISNLFKVFGMSFLFCFCFS